MVPIEVCSPKMASTNSSENTLNFGDVSEDIEFVSSATNLSNVLKQLEQCLRSKPDLFDDENINDMSAAERDLFLLFAINSMFWVKLKLEGQDPATHPVKQHLIKTRQLMQRKQAILDKRKRPVLDKNVAARFIRSGLWQPKKNASRDQDIQPMNKKIKFDSDDE